MFIKIKTLVFIVILFLNCISIYAQQQSEYPVELERKLLLEEIKLASTQENKILFEYSSGAKPTAKEFINIVKNEFWPIIEKIGRLNTISSLYYVGIDRALYRNIEEKEEWSKKQLESDQEATKMSTSNEYRNLLEKIDRIASKLEGELPEYFMNLWSEMKDSGFSTDELPILNRLSDLEQKIKDVANHSPIAKELSRYTKENDTIMRDFYSGVISFNEATQKKEALTPISYIAHGYYIGQNAKDYLNEAAILRTQLAQKKGFKNWAEYQLNHKKKYFTEEYIKASSRIEILRDYLESTQATHWDSITKRAKEIPEINLQQLTHSQIGLLQLPASKMITEYFPVKNVEAVWKKTMLESGFPQRVIDRINIDNYPRDGKQTHAYMMNAKSRNVKTLIVDSRDFSVKVPREYPRFWNSPLIYIVQNMRSDGIAAYSTAFHEGGHALDYNCRQDVLGFGQDSAYTETHSMTMEYFLSDPEFLLANGQTQSGQQISKELIEKYLKDKTLNDLSSNRTQALHSLFDLELWNHVYTEGGETFLDRFLKIQNQNFKQYYFIRAGHSIDGIDIHYGSLATDHFYNGSVRYIGYFFAGIASDMTYNFLLDRLEKETGKRTLYQQNGLAKILVNAYYKRGFAQKFPSQIENFTHTKFDIQSLLSKNNKQTISIRDTKMINETIIQNCENVFDL